MSPQRRPRDDLIEEYEVVVQPVVAGHGPSLLADVRERIEIELVVRKELRSRAVVLQYWPAQVTARRIVS